MCPLPKRGARLAAAQDKAALETLESRWNEEAGGPCSLFQGYLASLDGDPTASTPQQPQVDQGNSPSQYVPSPAVGPIVHLMCLRLLKVLLLLVHVIYFLLCCVRACFQVNLDFGWVRARWLDWWVRLRVSPNPGPECDTCHFGAHIHGSPLHLSFPRQDLPWPKVALPGITAPRHPLSPPST